MKLSFKFLSLVTIAGMVSMSSCNDDKTTTDTSDSSTVKTDTGMAKDDTKMEAANSDQDAVNVLVTKNETEMAWLMAGINMGTSKELKDHAKMMLADHKKLGEKVGSLITTKNWTKPTVDTMGVVTLTAPKGAEWDKAFTDQMVTDHSALLDKLNELETSVKDADLKKAVTDAKPVVQSHLDMVKMMQGKMK